MDGAPGLSFVVHQTTSPSERFSMSRLQVWQGMISRVFKPCSVMGVDGSPPSEGKQTSRVDATDDISLYWRRFHIEFRGDDA